MSPAKIRPLTGRPSGVKDQPLTTTRLPRSDPVTGASSRATIRRLHTAIAVVLITERKRPAHDARTEGRGACQGGIVMAPELCSDTRNVLQYWAWKSSTGTLGRTWQFRQSSS